MNLKQILVELIREQEKKKKKRVHIGDGEETHGEKATLQRVWDRVWKGRQ